MKGAFYYSFRYAATLRKPRLLARLAQNVARARLGSRPRLRYVDICASTKCNLSCEHCFATAFIAHERAPLTLTEWRDVAQQGMRLGCVSFGITGGEPLLYGDLIPLVRHLSPERNLITINTNGTLLTEPLARACYRAGVDVLQFSMDSAIPEEHDRFRGQRGAFRDLRRAIDVARQERLKVTLVCTLSRQNICTEGVRRLIDFAGQERMLLILSRAVPAGRWLANEDILLTPEDYELLYAWVRRYAHVRTDMDSNYACYGCSAATEKLYVTPLGDVIPCPFMHITFGNVREDSVATIRDRMLSVPCLSRYARVCHVAEDRGFIARVLSKTFDRTGLADWQECFNSLPDGDTAAADAPVDCEAECVR